MENKPPRIPSHTSPATQSGEPDSQPSASAVRLSVPSPSRLAKITPGEFMPPLPKTPSKAVPSSDTQPSGNSPPRYRKFSEKVRWKIANKITRKIGMPHILCVKTLSALSDLLSPPFIAFSPFLNAEEKCFVMYL